MRNWEDAEDGDMVPWPGPRCGMCRYWARVDEVNGICHKGKLRTMSMNGACSGWQFGVFGEGTSEQPTPWATSLVCSWSVSGEVG
jgi:hypothetical protein